MYINVSRRITFGLALRTQSENETRYIQYAVGEIDKVPNTYCKTIV
jgi:hypothetical protein